MLITTIISLSKEEVENLLNMKSTLNYEEHEDSIYACVDCFIDNETGKVITTDEAMEKLFVALKENGIARKDAVDFAFEVPSCGKTFDHDRANKNEIDLEFIISYSTTK